MQQFQQQSSQIPHPPTGNAGMASLPREVIKWIQTLSLSKPLKHPKRDFSNGYLVAEIMTRFIPSVDMTLFDNVHSTKNKIANWKALQRCLAKGGAAQIPEQLVQDVMSAKDGAGDELLTMMYTQFTSRAPPGSQPKGSQAGAAPPEPQALDRVPQFVKTLPGSDEHGNAVGGAAGGSNDHATKQLSAKAAEQLRAAELELMKQQTETDFKNELLGLGSDGTKPGDSKSGAGKNAQDDDPRSAAFAAQQAQKARILRQPAVPQTTTQGQIRAIDLEAEKQEKAILFNNVNVRQLSGAALQRFGFRDRSQSPSGRGAGSSSSPGFQKNQQQRGGGGRGGVGAAIHYHLCNLFDRFVAEYFSSSTTWNPPADSSPLSYFIENCSNSNVISPSFKANIWSFLHHEAQKTAAVLATAPIDTLYFVAHFANVSIESSAPRPGDPSFSDLAKPKFYGTDAFDATFYCHAVLGALRNLKCAAAETILRRYAFPAVLPVVFRNFDTTQQLGSLALSQQKSASLSVRRALFALSGLSMGNQQPLGASAITSCLNFCFSDQNSKTVSAVDENEAFEDKLTTNTISIHQFIEVIYDSILTNYESTVAFSSKIFSAELTQALSHTKISAISREVEFFNALELICNSIRGDPTPDKLVASDVVFPETLSLLIAHNIERGFSHESSSVQEASLRALVSLVQVSKVNSDSTEEVRGLVTKRLRNELLPALTEPRGIYSNVASGSTLMELLRLLCVSMRCCGNNNNSSINKGEPSSEAEGVAVAVDGDHENNNNGNDQQQINNSFKNEILDIATSCVTSVHHLALRESERLVLLSALASGLSNFDYNHSLLLSSNSPSKITVSNASGTLENTATYTEEKLDPAAKREREQQEKIQKIVTFCVDNLLALPPSALESFASSGGSITRAFSSVVAGTQDRLAFAPPLDFARWNVTAIGAGLAARFCSIPSLGNNNNNNNNNNNSNPVYKIPSPTKSGSAGVLKLPTPPSQQSKPEEYNKALQPFKAIILLFTLFSAKVQNARASMEDGGVCVSCNILRAHAQDSDAVVWWSVLSNGFAHEMKKLLLYYDAARKGPAALAQRKDQEAENFHEIYVQAGRAALFILGKLYQNVSNTVPSTMSQQSFGALFQGAAPRVSQPASKISDDDRVLGQVGLEVAGKAIEWLMTSVLPTSSRGGGGGGSSSSVGGDSMNASMNSVIPAGSSSGRSDSRQQ